ncbi:uncharacterized protein TNCT_649151 [Trichonephila clavata]|uniref:Uncharacterized protein n=1 Tax=Trichonephila clavata TaxID=2740835 RepID=A0A8X6G5Q2_TRICU|nr:uncharacterized protein TNCT_649151 [Trichonephila clavata]
MEHDPIFRNLVEKVLSKPGVEKMNLNMDKNKDRTPEVTLIESLLEIFPKVFAVIEISIKKNWDKCFDEGFIEVMLQSPKSYVKAMLTLCCTENEGTIDVYDRFLNVFALVNYVTNMYFTAAGANFYELSSLTLTVYYENMLRQDFEKRGGWKCLNKYIQAKKYVRCFHDCEKYNFVTDDFPKKLKVKIRDSFSYQLPSINFNAEIEYRFYRVVDCLTNEVMSSVKSPLNDLNSPKLNEDQSISKEAEGSSFSTANILEVSGTVVSKKSGLYPFCQSKVKDLEETLQYLLGVFELLDETQDT